MAVHGIGGNMTKSNTGSPVITDLTSQADVQENLRRVLEGLGKLRELSDPRMRRIYSVTYFLVRNALAILREGLEKE